MPRMIHSVVFRLLALLMLGGLSFAARAEAQTSLQAAQPAFEHSDNARRALGQYGKALQGLLQTYREGVAQAGGRFESTSERHIKRYKSQLERSVRDLTRASKIELATATKAMLERAGAWEITPPDAQGVHFLSDVGIEVEGNEKATKQGVDLLVEVEKASQAYLKQRDLVFDRYAREVRALREEYQASLERALDHEKQAGRLEAVKEVMSAIDLAKQITGVSRPGGDGLASGAAGQPAYVGYYAVAYTEGTRDRRSYFLELDEDGGMVYYQRWPRFRGLFKARVDWPITDLSAKRGKLTFRHRFSGDGIMEHEMTLEDGEPVFDKATEPNGYIKGRVYKLGTPDADLLGLEDGVYMLELTQHTSPFGKAVGVPAKLRLEIEQGVVAWTTTDWGFGRGYEKRHPHVMAVETKGKQLHMQMDPKVRFNDRDHVIVIDMAQDPPAVSQWWYIESYRKGVDAHMTGVLKKP